MYVAPRPRLTDDPYFAVRLALLCVISFAAVQWIKPVLPAMVVYIICCTRFMFVGSDLSYLEVLIAVLLCVFSA